MVFVCQIAENETRTLKVRSLIHPGTFLCGLGTDSQQQQGWVNLPITLVHETSSKCLWAFDLGAAMIQTNE